MDMCKFMEIIDEQTGNGPAKRARTMTNWLSSGEKPAFVFGNNDEMAIGAIQALKASGVDLKEVVVVGWTPRTTRSRRCRPATSTLLFFRMARPSVKEPRCSARLARGEDVDA